MQTDRERNQAIVDEINGKVDRMKEEALAERRILIFLRSINPPKKFKVRALALMTLGRGALIADMSSR